MKPSLILLFLTILLLCGILLRAATNTRKLRIEKIEEEMTKVDVKKDMVFVPNVIVL